MTTLLKDESNNLDQKVYKRRSKLVGLDAWRDIPEYLRKDIHITIDDYIAQYKIEDIFNIYLLLDYSSLVSSISYSDRFIPGKFVPLEGIDLRYFSNKATGNLANYHCPMSIDSRYPRKAELADMISRMRFTCREWDKNLITDLMEETGESSSARFLLTDFITTKMTIKELKPDLANFVNTYLKDLYVKLDNVSRQCIPRFRHGRAFGYYEVTPV